MFRNLVRSPIIYEHQVPTHATNAAVELWYKGYRERNNLYSKEVIAVNGLTLKINFRTLGEITPYQTTDEFEHSFMSSLQQATAEMPKIKICNEEFIIWINQHLKNKGIHGMYATCL